jgi:molybdopterin/thiamine biosynthesis adenylyltransferase
MEGVQERFSRHWSMIDVERLHETPFKIIGTGSVGSFTCLSLVKMGAHNIETWDDDLVDEANISNQFFRIKDIGEYKVDALQSLIKDFEDVTIINHPAKHQGKEDLSGIVIVALDSMLPRKRIWDSIKGKDSVELFIDPRMGGRVARIYAVNPRNGIEAYEKTLYTDDESAPERCTERTIIYNVLGISSMICKTIEDHFANPIEGCNELILDYATYTLMKDKC